MECSEIIRKRRSVRKYKKGAPVPAEHIRLMLEAAVYAPSAVNSRPWEFYVTDKESTRQKLMQAHPSCKMLETASAAIVVCGRPDLQPGREYWPQDCGAAIENILLQAADLGYGTCWCGCYPTEPRTSNVREVIGCDSIPVAIIAIGVPDETPAAKGFYDESRVHTF